MRRSRAAGAMFRRRRNGRTEWLAKWNGAWKRWALVGGHKHDDDTYRDCLVREIDEELGLTAGVDYDLAPVPPRRWRFTARSERAREMTAYSIAAFAASLSRQARATVDRDPRNCWLSADEIRAGRTSDGRPISDLFARAVRSARRTAVEP